MSAPCDICGPNPKECPTVLCASCALAPESGPKETLYDAQISPLMTQIIALCKEHKINMAVQFALDADEEKGTMFCTTLLCVDPGDVEGAERMNRLRPIMYPPAPRLFAFTIISKRDAP